MLLYLGMGRDDRVIERRWSDRMQQGLKACPHTLATVDKVAENGDKLGDKLSPKL